MPYLPRLYNASYFDASTGVLHQKQVRGKSEIADWLTPIDDDMVGAFSQPNGGYLSKIVWIKDNTTGLYRNRATPRMNKRFANIRFQLVEENS